jgi:hypothetical protein
MPVDIEHTVTFDFTTNEFVIEQPEKDNIRVPLWIIYSIHDKAKYIFKGLEN